MQYPIFIAAQSIYKDRILCHIITQSSLEHNATFYAGVLFDRPVSYLNAIRTSERSFPPPFS